MTATLQEEVQERLQQEIQAFTMPRPFKGQSVIWYGNADRKGPTEVCWVLRVGSRNVDVRPASGLARPAVFHVDDPRLRQSETIRENGAWDFTDKDKLESQHTEQIADLLKRVEKLEARGKN